jgi:hypothetical protein
MFYKLFHVKQLALFLGRLGGVTIYVGESFITTQP